MVPGARGIAEAPHVCTYVGFEDRVTPDWLDRYLPPVYD